MDRRRLGSSQVSVSRLSLGSWRTFERISREHALAIAFALANPAVATVLFGATSPAQIAENVTALDVDAATLQRLLAL